MSVQNSLNNYSDSFTCPSLTLDPGASGDSYVQFDINTTSEFRLGVDDDDSDAFKLSQGSSLGTNDTMVVASTGEITRPLQPAVCAYLASSVSNATGDGTTFTIGSGTALTERFDQGSNFVTSGTFTAPVTGAYYMQEVIVYTVAPGSGSVGGISQLTTSNRNYIGTNFPTRERVSGFYGPNLDIFARNQVIGDMDAADTVTAQGTINNGTKTTAIRGDANGNTYLSIYLVG